MKVNYGITVLVRVKIRSIWIWKKDRYKGIQEKKVCDNNHKKIYMFLANRTILFCAYILYNTSS